MTLPVFGLSRRRFQWQMLRFLGAGGAWVALTDSQAKTGLDILLAQNAPTKFDPRVYLVSEKLDGVRAVWDGREMRFRSGRPLAAPAWFLAKLPPTPMDGELWLGRGKFDQLSGIVRKEQPVDTDWQQIKYMVFELPGGDGDFQRRYYRMRFMAQGAQWPQFEAHEQFRVATLEALHDRLRQVVAAGGEGLMLHKTDADYVTGRSSVLLKLKPVADAEAEVVAHIPGKGRLEGILGALEVKTEDGIRFKLGTGFSDAQRKTPPPLGSRVTYTYRDVTPKGVPRFAAFLRMAAPE